MRLRAYLFRAFYPNARDAGNLNPMPANNPNVVYLAERPQAPDNHDVLHRIMRDHEPAIRRFLRARLANHPDYEDLVQDVYVKLTQQENLREKLSMGEAQTRSYLFSIATNLIRDRHRRRKTRREVQLTAADEERLPSHAPSTEEVFISRQNLAAIRSAILNLPGNCRRAFVLSRFNDLTYREIAEAMNISVSMVEKHIMRALAEIRSCVRI